MKNELERQLEIEAILSDNWGRFINWQQSTQSRQTLDIPDDIASVFIPKRVLELASIPHAVRTLVFNRTSIRDCSSGIGFLMFETMPDPITDKDKFDQYMIERTEKKEITLPSTPGDVPAGIDYKHVGLHQFIENGDLTLHDKYLLEYYADVPTDYPHVVMTRNLFDRSEMQGRGIGTSFYSRLESVLKTLEFRYLAGHILSRHPNFFRNRVRFSELPTEIKSQFPPHFAQHSEPGIWRNWMIKQL